MGVPLQDSRLDGCMPPFFSGLTQIFVEIHLFSCKHIMHQNPYIVSPPRHLKGEAFARVARNYIYYIQDISCSSSANTADVPLDMGSWIERRKHGAASIESQCRLKGQRVEFKNDWMPFIPKTGFPVSARASYA